MLYFWRKASDRPLSQIGHTREREGGREGDRDREKDGRKEGEGGREGGRWWGGGKGGGREGGRAQVAWFRLLRRIRRRLQDRRRSWLNRSGACPGSASSRTFQGPAAGCLGSDPVLCCTPRPRRVRGLVATRRPERAASREIAAQRPGRRSRSQRAVTSVRADLSVRAPPRGRGRWPCELESRVPCVAIARWRHPSGVARMLFPSSRGCLNYGAVKSCPPTHLAFRPLASRTTSSQNIEQERNFPDMHRRSRTSTVPCNDA